MWGKVPGRCNPKNAAAVVFDCRIKTIPGGDFMKGNVLVAVVVTLVVTVAANAGTIKGKVSGVSSESVVYVEAVAGKTFPAPSAHAAMDQKGLLFQPHILVVQQGTTVEFQNSDTVAHNVAWSSVGGNKRLAHNMGTWPKGEKRSFKFDNPGAIPLMCYVHPEMEAYIIVSPTPYFAQTDKSGTYKIDDVPDGSYTVTAWNEGAKGQSKPVTVSGDSTADFTLTKLIR
jgi:plastocyanin